MFQLKMRAMKQYLKLSIWIFIFVCSVSEAKQSSYTFDISSFDPNNTSTHKFYRYVPPSNQSIDIVVTSNSTNRTGFYIIQAHSQRWNISLTHHGDVIKNVTGNNVGILQFFQQTFSDSFLLQNSTQNNSIVLVAVTVYDDKAPIPGGCSKERNISPTLKVFDGPDILTVKAEAPSSNDRSCNDSMNNVKIEIYHKYLPSHDFDQSSYMESINSMLGVEDVKSNGRLVATLQGYSSIGKFFSSYIGTGEVFSVLVYENSVASAYVPAVSYGDDLNNLIEKKEKGTQGQDIFVVLFSVLPFVALLIIYRGHAFFHFTTFSLGLSCGTIISFFVLSTEGATTVDHTFFLSLLVGLLYGSVWMGIWYKFGVPLLSATLAFLHAGALLASVIYYLGVADDENFRNNAIYWTVFTAIVFMCWFSLSMFTMHGHILSCAFLGSYILMITTLNYWFGGNLQYILINVYRRMFVPNFDEAILAPPFQLLDHAIALVCILFILHGFKKQVKNQLGKPPFPPHKSFRANSERSPLLG